MNCLLSRMAGLIMLKPELGAVKVVFSTASCQQVIYLAGM
jgi:hypothetical protein